MDRLAGSDNLAAIGSFEYHYEEGKREIKKRTISITPPFIKQKYKFHFIPKEKGWSYSIAERHMPHLFKWKLEIWKK